MRAWYHTCSVSIRYPQEAYRRTTISITPSLFPTGVTWTSQPLSLFFLCQPKIIFFFPSASILTRVKSVLFPSLLLANSYVTTVRESLGLSLITSRFLFRLDRFKHHYNPHLLPPAPASHPHIPTVHI